MKKGSNFRCGLPEKVQTLTWLSHRRSRFMCIGTLMETNVIRFLNGKPKAHKFSRNFFNGRAIVSASHKRLPGHVAAEPCETSNNPSLLTDFQKTYRTGHMRHGCNQGKRQSHPNEPTHHHEQSNLEAHCVRQDWKGQTQREITSLSIARDARCGWRQADHSLPEAKRIDHPCFVVEHS